MPLAGVGDPLPDLPWRDQLRILAGRLRAALLAHRDGARVVAGTYGGGTNTLTAGEAAVEVLCGAGLAPDQAGSLTFALFYYILGHVIEEQALAQMSDCIDWRGGLERSGVEASPRFAAALDSLTADDATNRFTYGLEVFLDGIAGQVTKTPKAAA
jgi:hypothetical protein